MVTVPTLVILKGLPASGKSTLARELVAEGYKRVNKDELRLMMDNGKFNGKNEKLIEDTCLFIIRTSLEAGFDVVSDNTNLVPSWIDDQYRVAESVGADVKIVIIKTPLSECLRRDKEREESKRVGAFVILNMFNKYFATWEGKHVGH